MAKVVPQTRPPPEVDRGMTSAEKKPRLHLAVEEQATPSTSTKPKSTKQKQASGETQSKKKKASKRRKNRHLPPEPYSHDDVLWRDVRDLLGAGVADAIIEEGNEWESPFQSKDELLVQVSAISSTGVSPHSVFLLLGISSNSVPPFL